MVTLTALGLLFNLALLPIPEPLPPFGAGRAREQHRREAVRRAAYRVMQGQPGIIIVHPKRRRSYAYR